MITPQQIDQISFSQSRHGYDMEQVDKILEPLTEDYVTLYKENALLKSKMRVLVGKLEEYRKSEAGMKDAMVNAQRTCDRMVREAEEKCARMLKDANADAAAAVRNAKSAMYSLVAYFIAYKMIDVVTNGLDEMKGMLIVTGKHDQVTDCLTKDMGRAVTLINGEGAYKREKTMILYCVVSRLEVTKIRDAITSVDSNAFVSVFDISEAHGGLFKRHKMHG